MKIEYIEEVIQSNYDGVDENIEFYYEFLAHDTLERILEIHLNSNYENCLASDFKSSKNFPHYYSRDIYNTINMILDGGLHEEISFYYERALRIRNDLDSIYQQDNISNLRIKFKNTDYLLFQDALDMIRTIFLQQIPKSILFKFIKSLIFESNFRNSPEELLLKQKDDLKYTINYSAFIYFIQKDLTILNIKDFYSIKNDFLGLNIYINPFFDQQTEIKEVIRKIFYDTDSISLKKAKYVTKTERLERIFDVYLMTEYPQVYFNHKRKIKVTNSEIYQELRKLGYLFQNGDENSSDKISAVDSYPTNIYIVKEKEVIKKIKKIDLKLN